MPTNEEGYPTCNRGCLYENGSSSWGSDANGCDYLLKTGCSRVKGIYKTLGINKMTRRAKEMLEPENCPYFSPSGKPPRVQEPKQVTLSFDVERFRALYETGMQDKDLAKSFEVTPKTISNWRRSLGLEPHKRSFQKRMNERKAKALYEQGLSDDDIAAQCHCSHTTIAKWRKREGLPPHYFKGKRVESSETLCDPV